MKYNYNMFICLSFHLLYFCLLTARMSTIEVYCYKFKIKKKIIFAAKKRCTCQKFTLNPILSFYPELGLKSCSMHFTFIAIS